MLVSDYIDVLRDRLLDPAPGAGWNNAELIAGLNEAIRGTCLVKPDAYTLQDFVLLAAGVTQELPADGIALFDISENETSGRRITIVDRKLLDEENRFWPAATQEVDVQHFTADALAPRRFYVTPPNNGAGSVKTLYGALPAPVSILSDPVPLADVYQPALVAYVLGVAWAKPGQRQNLQASQASTAAWGMLVGAKTKAQAQTAPKVSSMQGVA